MSMVSWKQIDNLAKKRPSRDEAASEEEYENTLDSSVQKAQALLRFVDEELAETMLGRQKIALEKHISDISTEIYTKYE